MQITAKQISELLNGTIEGNPDAIVSDLAKIEQGHEHALSFLSNPKYESYLYTTAASVVIVSNDFKPSQAVKPTLIRVADPYSAFSTLLDKYNEITAQGKAAQQGIEAQAFVHPTAKIGKGVYIAAFAYIDEGAVIGDNTKVYAQVYVGSNARVGQDCFLHPGVKIYHNCVLGNEVMIHANTVIGSDGFGFAPQKDGSYNKIPQIGNVIIEDRVEIGANCVIDRATMGSTIIGKGVKFDNLIQIAHNVEIGAHTVIAAQTGISGSAKLGPNCVIGGQAGIAGHISIAKGSQVGAQSGINGNIEEENQLWHGTPIQPYKNWLRSSVYFKKLPDFDKRLWKIEKQILRNSKADKDTES